MRIIRGRWAGRPLASPSGRVRPTAEEVRDGWLTGLREELAGARVLDLFAGTGALGLEAMSRGARRCDFVETNPSALHALKANVAALRLRDRARIFKRDALDFVGGIADPYDLAFADPPYESRQLDRLIEIWLGEPFSRVLSVEHASGHVLPGDPQAIYFGETTISTFGRGS